MLRYLVDHSTQLVTKAALLDAVWADLAISDSMPAICVSELRKALGDAAKVPQFIATVRGRGYRFIAKVTTAPAPDRATEPPALLSSASPMVGRDRELAQLRNWFIDVTAGRRQIVFVAGEPGIGKTTFVRTFLARLAQEGNARIGHGQCVEQYGAGEPYLPVLDALTRLGQEAGGEALVTMLRRVAPSWLAQMPALLTAKERGRIQAEAQGVTQQRMLREMVLALEALAADVPLILLIEDLHWSDFSTLDLLAMIARRAKRARLLIIGTYRPVEMLANGHPLRAVKAELAIHQQCQELRLRLLNEADIAVYLAQRFGDDEGRRFAGLAPVIHTRTEGNPLFMVNVVDYLAAQGSAFDASKIAAPHNIRQMIERNLERLTADDQSVLECASVVGTGFSAAAVAAALERPVSEVEACCTHLARQEQFVNAQAMREWPDGTVASSFRFQHALYRDVLYDRVPAGHRVELHRRIAAREERAYGDRAGEIASELAHHYRNANDKNKAITYLAIAGRQAIERSAHADAIGSLTTALELLMTFPDNADRMQRELPLRMALGQAFIPAKGWSAPEVERAYTRASELCVRLGHRAEISLALFGLWAMYTVRGDLRKAYELGEELIRQTQSLDPAVLTHSHMARGVTSYWMGEFHTAREHLEMAISLYDPERHAPLAFRYGGPPVGVVCRSYAALTLWQLGYPDRALEMGSEALASAQALSLPSGLSTAKLFVGGMLDQYRRKAGETQTSAEDVIALSAQQGMADYLAWATSLRGWAMAEQDRNEDGIAQIREGLGMGHALVIRPYFLCLLAEVCMKTNRLDEGLKALREALAAVDQHENRFHEAETHRLKGELLLRQDDPNTADAQHSFERALEIARKQSAKMLELRATTSLARLLDKQGRRDEARKMLAAIYNWFTEGFDTVDLKEAKALLDELNAPSRRRRATSR